MKSIESIVTEKRESGISGSSVFEFGSGRKRCRKKIETEVAGFCS